MDNLIALLTAIGAVLAAGLWTYRAGQQKQKEKQRQYELDLLKKAKKVQDDLDHKSPDDKRRALDGWMRD